MTTDAENCDATLLFIGEDHTLGVLLRHQLLENPIVIFAAYKTPHPLTKSVEVRIQTLGNPVIETTNAALENLCGQVDDFSSAFSSALEN